MKIYRDILFYTYSIFLFATSIVFAQNWQIVWRDEFLGNSIDLSKWEHEVNGNGGGNNELQYYTARDTNSFVENGSLVIRALKETFTGPDGTRSYTSARLRTKNKGDWKYGKMEIRAMLPAGVGTWPAIWMLPTDWVYGEWPNSGEIDIMEHVGFDPGVVHGTVHTKAYNGLIGNQKGAAVLIQDATSAFHVYSIEWSPLKIDFFVDNSKYFTFDNEGLGWEKWPFDQRFHLISNIAIGGNWGGLQGVDDSIFPVQMVIDYVRVYQDPDAAPSGSITFPQNGDHFNAGDKITISVNATDGDGTVDKVEFFQDEAKLGQANSQPFEWTVENSYSGCYTLKAVVTDNDGFSTETAAINITVGDSCGQAPYRIAPEPIPGIIEAENYDLGGEGVAYHDNDAINNGNGQGDGYRHLEGVDVEPTGDVGGGYNVGWMESGEWMEYLVNVGNTGIYTVISRVASETGGGSFNLSLDGQDVSGVINVSATGGWQQWASIFTENVFLTRGVHKMRLNVLSSGFNFNKLTIFAVSVGTGDIADNPIPVNFELEQNFPNPFNPTTTIRYSLPQNSTVRLEIFNAAGQRIKTLVEKHQTAGVYEVSFDGSKLSSGVYFYRLQTDNFVRTRKMLLVL